MNWKSTWTGYNFFSTPKPLSSSTLSRRVRGTPRRGNHITWAPKSSNLNCARCYCGVCIGCHKEKHINSKTPNWKHFAHGVIARVQHMERIRSTASQKVATLLLYWIWQQLAEPESDECKCQDSETFFAKREIIIKSWKRQGVSTQQSDIIDPPQFPVLEMIFHYPTNKKMNIINEEVL